MVRARRCQRCHEAGVDATRYWHPGMRYKDEFAWEVRVDAGTLNAFCAAGGYICFYTGILKFLDTEAQVAGVMGGARWRTPTAGIPQTTDQELRYFDAFGHIGGRQCERFDKDSRPDGAEER